MSKGTRINRHFIFGVLVLAAAAGWIAGCGGESSKPKPVLHALGAILMDRTVPAGGPYAVAVVVSLDNTPVTDATVTVNGTPLVYLADPAEAAHDGYVGVVNLTEGDAVTLSVSCASGDKTAAATTPGLVQVLTPSAGAAFADSAEVPVTWTPAEHALITIVACGDAMNGEAGTWLLQKDADSYAVPASSTNPPGTRVSVMAMNGQGAMPTADLRQWVGQDGFWVGSQDWVDVQINP
jgi:hypothetical protein